MRTRQESVPLCAHKKTTDSVVSPPREPRVVRASRISPLAGCDAPVVNLRRPLAAYAEAGTPREAPFRHRWYSVPHLLSQDREARPAGDWPSAPPERPAFHSLHMYYATAAKFVLSGVRFGSINHCLGVNIPRQFEPIGERFIARVQEGEFLTVGRKHGLADAGRDDPDVHVLENKEQVAGRGSPQVARG